ncbi:MAG: hypothetical protein JWO64_2218, partial [Hyphomicrobiales bacterium]|nr:hypothetical protein [Hyphomicrobiales bacterium]
MNAPFTPPMIPLIPEYAPFNDE